MEELVSPKNSRAQQAAAKHTRRCERKKRANQPQGVAVLVIRKSRIRATSKRSVLLVGHSCHDALVFVDSCAPGSGQSL